MLSEQGKGVSVLRRVQEHSDETFPCECVALMRKKTVPIHDLFQKVEQRKFFHQSGIRIQLEARLVQWLILYLPCPELNTASSPGCGVIHILLGDVEERKNVNVLRVAPPVSFNVLDKAAVEKLQASGIPTARYDLSVAYQVSQQLPSVGRGAKCLDHFRHGDYVGRPFRIGRV